MKGAKAKKQRGRELSGWGRGVREERRIEKARLHMRFLMRFCVQNLPQPTPHVGFFVMQGCDKMPPS